MPRWIQDIIPKDRRYKKYFTNLQRELQGELSLSNLPYGRVSLLVFSDDGKQAYICEQDGTITITSQDKQVIMYIDRISLSIEDNILFATFNKASDLFMIWKNLSIQVFSVNNRSRIFYLNLNNRPALKVEFCEDGVSFDVTLVNNQSYHFRRVKNTFVPNCKLPSALSSDANSNTYGPYFAGHNGNTYSISSLIPYFSEEASPREWFSNHCEFSVGNDSIIVKDSVLFCRRANGITTEIVGNVDLKKSHLIEQQQDGSFLETFLREKNILFTQFYEKIDTAESIIIMVSITLSSVIAIDTKSCRILDAIKIEGGIIGSHMTEGNVLTVYTKNGVFNYHVDCSLQKD